MPAIVGTLPFTIAAGQLVSAAPVMGNYTFIQSQVNANAMPLTGPATFTGAMTITGTLGVSAGIAISGPAGIGGIASFTATLNGVAGILVQNSNAGAAAECDSYFQSDTGVFRIQVQSNALGSGLTRLFSQTNTALNIGTNNTDRITIAAAGNVAVNAPASGTALSATGLAGNAAVAVTSGSEAAGVAAVLVSSGGGTFGHMGGGLTNNMPWLASINSADYSAATFGWLWINDSSAGNLTLNRRAGSTTNNPLLQFVRSTGVGNYNDGTTNAEIGWRSLPPITFNGTLVVAHRSKMLQINGGITAPNAVFSAGDVVVLANTSGSSQTLTQGGGFTLTLAGTGLTGNRTIGTNSVVSLLFQSASSAFCYGPGLT